MKKLVTKTHLYALMATLALLGYSRRARCPEVGVGGGPPVDVGTQMTPHGQYHQQQTQKIYLGTPHRMTSPPIKMPSERRGLMNLYDWAEGKRPASAADEQHKLQEQAFKLHKEELKLLEEILGKEGIKEYLMGPSTIARPTPAYQSVYPPSAPPMYPPYTAQHPANPVYAQPPVQPVAYPTYAPMPSPVHPPYVYPTYSQPLPAQPICPLPIMHPAMPAQATPKAAPKAPIKRSSASRHTGE